MPLAERLAAELRELCKSGELALNCSGAAGWRTGDDLWLVSQRVADALRASLALAGQPGVPAQNNSRVFDILQAHGILRLHEGKAVWRATVKGDGFSHAATLLRIPVSQIWPSPDDAPPLFEGAVEPAVADKIKIAATVPEAESTVGPGIGEASPAPGSTVDLGMRLVTWVRAALEEKKLSCNRAKSKVHVISEGVLLVSPGIFREFSADQGVQWAVAQGAFLRLKLHERTAAGVNMHRFVIESTDTVISAVLLKDASLIFGGAIPAASDNIRRA